MMRLDKYLADCGAGTRTQVKKLIKSGAVAVDGVAKITADTKIDPSSAVVWLNGERLSYRQFVYLMLDKPEGYISATWDKHKPVVTELVPEELAHFDVFPVGRLDIDTTGLCILTNDGTLAHKLLSPARHVPKTYIAQVDGPVGEKEITAFESGMDLGDFVAKPAILEIIETAEDNSLAKVVIAEGKFHQVKRMFEKCGLTVTALRRTEMNRLKLDDNLGAGGIRELTDEELEMLTYGTN